MDLSLPSGDLSDQGVRQDLWRRVEEEDPYLTVIAPVTDRTLELTSRPDGG